MYKYIYFPTTVFDMTPTLLDMARTSLIVSSQRVLYSLLSLLLLSFVPTQSAPEAALITQIPGFNGTLPSKHYSGYAGFLKLFGTYGISEFWLLISICGVLTFEGM